MRRGTFWSPVPPGTVAVVGLPRPDEKSLAGTRCISATRDIPTTAHSSLNEMHVFRLGVGELCGLTRIIHDRHRPPLRSFPSIRRQRSSAMRPGIAVGALPCLDEKSLSRTRCFRPQSEVFCRNVLWCSALPVFRPSDHE